MRITQIRAEGKWAAGDCRADGKSSAMRHIYMPMAASAPLLPCAIAIASASARTQLLYLATPTPPLPMYSRRTYSSHHQRHNNQPAANSIYSPRSTATPPQLVADSRHQLARFLMESIMRFLSFCGRQLVCTYSDNSGLLQWWHIYLPAKGFSHSEQ